MKGVHKYWYFVEENFLFPSSGTPPAARSSVLILAGLDFIGGMHFVERLIERRRRRLRTEADRVHPRHHETLQIGTGEAARLQGLDL